MIFFVFFFSGKTSSSNTSLEQISPWLVSDSIVVSKKEKEKSKIPQLKTVITTELWKERKKREKERKERKKEERKRKDSDDERYIQYYIPREEKCML